MRFAPLTTSFLLSVAVAAGGFYFERAFAEDSSNTVAESQDGLIRDVPELARSIWAILDAIERAHVDGLARRDLLEIVARRLRGFRDGPLLNVNVDELNATVDEMAGCQNSDRFADWLCKYAKADPGGLVWATDLLTPGTIDDRSESNSPRGNTRPNVPPLDQLQSRILNSLEAKVGYLRLIRAKDSIVEEQIRNNRYVGLGISIGSEDANLSLSMVFPGGPADRGGLVRGTRIEEIDGRSTRDVPMQTAIEWIRGPIGTEVTLKILDPGRDRQSRFITLKRGVIFFDSVGVGRDNSPLSKGSVCGEDADRVGWIWINDVKSSTLSELRAADAKVRNERVRVLVLDFHGASQSTDLHQAQLIADGLIDGGILWFRTERGEEPHPDIADRECLFRGIPLVVLLHQRTGAELSAIAAALQDAGRAKIVGDSPKFNGALTSTVNLVDVPFALALQTARLTRARQERSWPVVPDYPSVVAVDWQTQFRETVELAQANDILARKKRTQRLLETTASALAPANVRPGIRARVHDLREQLSQPFEIQPVPVVQPETENGIAERVARELLKTLPKEIAE